MHGTNNEFLMSLKSSVFLVIVSDINMLVDLIKTNKQSNKTNTHMQRPLPYPKLPKNPLEDDFES